jgi:organic hydroperoxide reductase OsmC/OhrA
MATDKTHQYKATIKWTGNKGSGTSHYQAYERDYLISIDSKENIVGSSDPAFRGDKTKHNPEELLVSSLSACHMLWYLHLCSQEGIVVTDYMDNVTGIMKETDNGSGHFTELTLEPAVTVTEPEMIAKAIELHKKANELCFIANSVRFPVFHSPTVRSK